MSLRFNAVTTAQRRVVIEQRAQALFASAQAVARRRAAGEDRRLDANVASIEAERARNALAASGERLLDARGELAAVLQLPPARLPEVAGDQAATPGQALPYELEQLLFYAGAATLEQERKAWHAVQRMPRSDPGYATAISKWQGAAHLIGEPRFPPTCVRLAATLCQPPPPRRPREGASLGWRLRAGWSASTHPMAIRESVAGVFVGIHSRARNRCP